MSDNTELIAKARKFAAYSEGGGSKGLLGQVLGALEAAEQWRANAQITLDHDKAHMDALSEQLAAAQDEIRRLGGTP